MVIINIVKIKLTNATEYCLLNGVAVKLFLPTELVLIHHILIWSRSMGLDMIWKNLFYFEWEMKITYQHIFLVRKKWEFFFLFKAFPSSFAVNVS